MKMKNFSKTLLVIMIGTMGFSSCADSWEEMRKEKYEKEWVKTFGEVDPNHTWNLATQVTADLAIKEDALTEYTFKVYTSDPIWGTDAKLLAKATVKTDEVGYAETQIKFDAPSSMETYYITRTDSHGRRLLKVSDIENKKIEVKFGISNYSAESRGLYEEVSFENLKIENPYTLEWINEKLESTEVKEITNENTNTSISNLGGIVKAINSMPKRNTGFTYNGSNDNKSILIIAGKDIVYETTGNFDPNNREYFSNIDIIIAPNSSLILKQGIQLGSNARIFIMEGGTLNAFPGEYDNQFQKTSIDVEASSSLFYNAGILDVDHMRIQAGTFYNAETGVLPGNGDPNENPKQSVLSLSDAGTVTNFGKLKANRIIGTQDFSSDQAAADATTQQGTLNNGCFIDVDERIVIKFLNINSNSTIESKAIIINSLSIRDNSIIRSEVFSSQNSDAGWKYIGDTGKALISTQKTSYLQDGDVKVVGPIYFESNEYGDETDKTEITRAYSEETATGSVSQVGNAPILIIPDHNYNGDDVSKYDCVGHGNIPQEFQTIIDKNIEWAIAFEDLGDIGDYDFNDVVIGVSQDGNKIKVTALAAGGTLPADVYYKNEKLGEIHELLNRAGDYSPINVKNKRNEESGKRKIYEIDPDDFSIEDNWTDFTIQVNGKASATITPSVTVGNVPQALCIPSDWLWPKESINIGDAYADFTNWVQDQDNFKEWYKYHTDGKVAVDQ